MDLLLDYDFIRTRRRRTLAGIAKDDMKSNVNQDADRRYTEKCRDEHGDCESDELPLPA